ncbi:erg24, C-14 sterol reductase [Friedmanniomyces endolithicus]|uniref:Delta(14)-sterol reductase n=1 Tax=Friedmanniomyces endolithicus TaxID=329885 RepID=A0AAN6HAJ5_9PEZI|nr:erg24, C-14 sterol reductase [Friedmanniomyces endolithicus]
MATQRRREKAAETETAVEPIGAGKSEAHGYEFGGPIGTFILTFGLPFVCYAFVFLCNDVTGCPAPSLLSPSKLFAPPALSTQSPRQYALNTLKRETGWPGLGGLINAEAMLGTLAWYGLSLLLHVLLPAQEVEGTELATGLCAAGTFVLGPNFQLWTFINTHMVQLLTTNILFAYLLATYFYLRSFSVKRGNSTHRELAAGGHTGNIMYDFFIGRELNPRVTIPYVGEIDVKSFMELRPGMLGWIVLNLAYMAKQYKSYGYITDSMLIVNFTQALYVLDALYMESAILTTLDLTRDGFGFMLAFGDIPWLPFTYSLQARYLAVHPVILGPWYSLAIMAIGIAGYIIFRGSNNEKNVFRKNPDDPSVAHLEYIQTASGSKLLTSGWWGRARHINYLGDWLLSWSYSLPTLLSGYRLTNSILTPGSRLVTTDGMKGWAIPVTYFYLLYFAILLVHRERRDEEKCRKKYGRDWEEYVAKVPYRIIPGVY